MAQMVKNAAGRKVALLLHPANIGKSWSIADILYIDKTASNINLVNKKLTWSLIKLSFSQLPDEAKNTLKYFSEENVQMKIAEVKTGYNITKQLTSESRYAEKIAVKYFHTAFTSLKPYLPLLKFYEQLPRGNSAFTTAPVTFSAFRPSLAFEVKKSGSDLKIEALVSINDFNCSLDNYNRFHFLLKSNDEFFILSYKDYQTLQWIEENKQPSANGVSLMQMLVTLEQDYKVNRNDLFEKKQVEAIPLPRVFLSELNNSILMLTPQWMYDGVLVEGPFKPYFETKAGGEELAVQRDREEEQKLIDFLLSLNENFKNQRNGYYYLSFAEAQKKQWFLKSYHKLLDAGVQLAGMDMLNHFRYSPHKIETSYSITQQEGNKLLIEMNISFGNEKLNLSELQKMILSGQKAVLLKDGSLGILNDEWLSEYGTIMRHGKVAAGTLEVSKFMAVSIGQVQQERTLFSSFLKEQWWQKWKQWQSSDEPLYPVPSIVKASLRPYQQKGYDWLCLLAEIGAGCCLADDMGLGKTLQTICFLARYQQHNSSLPNLIVAPASLLYNWQQEFQKFAPSLTTVVYHGVERDAEDIFSNNCNVIITSYGTLRSDAAIMLSHKYGLAVLDESHNIKNPSAQITGVVQQLDAFVRIALSGTPVINNTFDLYSQLSYSLPGMFGSKDFFKREYADAIDRYQDEEKIKTLQKLTAPFILRRSKEQVAKDLPAKTESILWCSMGSGQQSLYNEIQEQVRSNLFMDIQANGLAKSKLAVIQGILKLRQICNSPMLLPAEERRYITDSVKVETLMAELQNLLGKHKVLVFSQFATMLHLLAAELEKKEISHFHFDGQTPPARRAEMVSEFQEPACKTNLFLISLKAGNTGLTLTAADYVFLFDPYWNSATEQQAIDRTHRIGQTKNVFAYKIICKDTIEEKIIQLQARKQKIADELVSEDNGFIKSLTEEDLHFLFS